MSSRHLRVLGGERLASEPFDRPPFSLATQRQRPGELCETLNVDFPPNKLSAAGAHAAEAGIPVELWIAITLESERALAEAAALCEVPSEVVSSMADEAARHRSTKTIMPGAARRLVEYGSALRIGDDRLRVLDCRRSPVLAIAPTVLTSWTLAAAALELNLCEWIAAQRLPAGRHMWEAAAAEAGLPLDGWVVRQAISCARSRNAPAHSAA